MRTHTGLHESFRPTCYWQFADPVSTVIHDIKGEFRRRRVSEALRVGDPVPEWALSPLLDRHGLQALAELGPAALAGEYLPPDARGETMIARIVVASLVDHVIEVRARPDGHMLRYRVVDELGLEYTTPLEWTERPLSFAELTRFLMEIRREGRAGRGVIERALARFYSGPTLATFGAALDWSLRARNAVRVTSDHYPDLAKWGERLTDRRRPYSPHHHRLPDRSFAVEAPAWDRATEPVPLHWEPAINSLLYRYEASVHYVSDRDDRHVPLADLAAFVRGHALEHGRLPVGPHEIVTDADERHAVDFDALLDEGEMMERVLADGTRVTDFWYDEVIQALAAVGCIRRFRDRLYLVGEGRILGPFEDPEDVQSEFYDGDGLSGLGTVVAYQEWDSGAAGAGAGIVRVYRIEGLYFLDDDMGINGPHADKREPMRLGGVDRVSRATVELWDEDHGYRYPDADYENAVAPDAGEAAHD